MLVDLTMGRVETEYQRERLARSFRRRSRRSPETVAVSGRRLRERRFIDPIWNRKSAAGS